MIYKEIDRDLLIRKRRIAFELGESTLPKYAKKFIERVLDSEELTPTLSETEIRADERAKTIDEEPRIKAFNAIYDICDDMIHDIEWYDVLARQKFDEIKRIVFDCEEQMKEQNNE